MSVHDVHVERSVLVVLNLLQGVVATQGSAGVLHGNFLYRTGLGITTILGIILQEVAVAVGMGVVLGRCVELVNKHDVGQIQRVVIALTILTALDIDIQGREVGRVIVQRGAGRADIAGTMDVDDITRVHTSDGALIVPVHGCGGHRVGTILGDEVERAAIVVGAVGDVYDKLQVSTVVARGHGEVQTRTVQDVEVSTILLTELGTVNRPRSGGINVAR